MPLRSQTPAPPRATQPAPPAEPQPIPPTGPSVAEFDKYHEQAWQLYNRHGSPNDPDLERALSGRSFEGHSRTVNAWEKSYLYRALITSVALIVALMVAGLYGVDLRHATAAREYLDPKWIYAEAVVLVTCIVAVIGLIPAVGKRSGCRALGSCLVHWVLFICWATLLGIFGKLYFPPTSPHGDKAIFRMVVAVWVDLAATGLWALLAIIETIFMLFFSGTWHKEEVARQQEEDYKLCKKLRKKGLYPPRCRPECIHVPMPRPQSKAPKSAAPKPKAPKSKAPKSRPSKSMRSEAFDDSSPDPLFSIL